MPTGIFVTQENYPTIRAALDLSLDENIIPDELIEMPIYLPIAEEEVKRQDPTWAEDSLDTTNALHMTNAAIFYCAGLLSMAVPQMEMEYFGEYRYHRNLVDWRTVAGNLRQRGDSEMAYVKQGGTLTLNRPTAFAVAPGQRERATRNGSWRS